MDEKVFAFNGANLTVMVDGDGNPWWVAGQVCEVLGIANASDAVRALDDDEKDKIGITDSIGRVRDRPSINESGLYSLIFKSRKPEARNFKRWVTGDVLPQIRKTGGYGKPVQLTRAELAQMVLDAEEEKEQFAQIAEAQKDRADQAVKEKAWISKGREAQAMRRAGLEVRRNNALLDELGMGPKWKTVRSIDWVGQYFKSDLGTLKMVGRRLVQLSRQMGKEINETQDPLFEKVNRYHISVIKKFRQLLDDDPGFMEEYRLELD